MDPRVLELLAAFAPFSRPVVGTGRNDALQAHDDGDAVFGLGGRDRLGSSHNRTLLFGGDDGDVLSTVLVMPPSDEATRGLAFQSGGAGNDTMNARVSYLEQSPLVGSAGDRAIAIVQDGGAGADVIRTEASGGLFTFGSMAVDTFVYGGSGNDRIVVAADGRGGLAASHVANVVDGGSGDDRISASARTEFSAAQGDASNDVNAGDGNDFVDVTVLAQSNSNRLASNVVHGGRGDDVVHASNQVNSNFGAPVSVIELHGNAGNDQLVAVARTGIAGLPDHSTMLDGGTGDDLLAADTLTQGFRVASQNDLAGGVGNDTLSARLEALALGGFDGAPVLDASNGLEGGAGDDRLDATLLVNPGSNLSADSKAANWLSGGDGSDRLTASATFNGVSPGPGLVANHLDGGAGNDVLVGTIAAGTQGASHLFGGAADDRLTVVGGKDNLLDGGSGRDTLIGGTGDDLMDGGADADRFVFAASNGHDRVVFVHGQDRIDLTGLAGARIHSLGDLHVGLDGGNTVISFDVDNTITVLDTHQLLAGDFLFG